ncbi:MAG: winged helix-turn-helix domain-containing protein [Candidatus Bathyarchaeia archaeon]
MKQSKLEHYIAIIQIMGQQTLTKLSYVAEKTGVTLDVLEQRIQFLVKQGLVEQKRLGNNEILSLTEDGKKVFNYFMKRQKGTTAGAPINILLALAERSPSKLLWLMYKTSLSGDALKSFLDVLIKQGLVEEKLLEKHMACYAITHYGLSVLKSFKDALEVLPPFNPWSGEPYSDFFSK